MATGLFDAVEPPAALPEPPAAYRSVSGWAIASLVLAIFSPLGFAGWSFAVVPAIGLVVGLTGWWRIAARRDVLTGEMLSAAAAAVCGCMLCGGLAYQWTVYVQELPEGYERIGYAMLQPLEGDPPTAIPPSAVAVDGRDVLLKGYMYPGKQQRGIRQFLLVRDQGDCCFGGNPKITDRVLVSMRDGELIDFSPRMVKIAGRFAVRPAGTGAVAGGVFYHLEEAFVR